jgi:transcriptional regulator EpsA
MNQALSGMFTDGNHCELSNMSETEQAELDRRILSIITECTGVQTADDFSRVVEGPLREVLPHEMMVCGIGGVSRQGNNVHKLLYYNYTFEQYKYYESLLNSDGRADSPLMKKWRETQEPVYFQSGRDDADFPQDWVENFKQHKMRNTIGHGVMDLTGSYSSYFIFSLLPVEVGPHEAHLLKLITPHLHLALSRALATVPEYPWNLGAAKKPLSERQLEILYWMHEGKTNWEIAKILNLTEINVKYHVDQIFVKLEVRKRVHAVAKAHALGLLRPQHN